MYSSLKFLSLAAIFGLVSAQSNVQIVVKNQCSYDVVVGQLTNGNNNVQNDLVAQGATKSYPLPSNWQGRFWGRNANICNTSNCPAESAANPASLAEFTFRGSGGSDFYDVSFVDGYNLPISISPISPSNADSSNHYSCGSPACANLPSCESDMQVTVNGQFAGCKSACSAFNQPQYCCTGSYSTPDTCKPNQYSQAIKSACPDVYSYAYDDATSTFTCVAQGYTITFCP